MNIKRFVSLLIIVLIIVLTVVFFLYPLVVLVQQWNQNPMYLGQPLQEFYGNNFNAFITEKYISRVREWLVIGRLIGPIVGIASLIVLVGIYKKIPEKKKEKNQKKLTD